MGPVFSALLALVLAAGPLLALAALRSPRSWQRVLAVSVGAEVAVFYAMAFAGSFVAEKCGGEPFWPWLLQLTLAASAVGAIVGMRYLAARRALEFWRGRAA